MKNPVPFRQFLTSAGAVSVVALTLFSTIAPAANAAGQSLEISGWIPYWAGTKGTTDADSHISAFTEINPFGYTVKSDGTVYDAMGVSSSNWQTLFQDAHNKGVKVVPTIMWSDTDTIYNILSNPTTRATHIQSIVNAVVQNNFDGVDIDYEGKSAETKDYYSAFLSELSAALYNANKNLTLDCTIESREPLAARYSGTPPADIAYANDLPTINKYCDRVRIMTYDQQDADIQLDNAHSNELYAPVSDAAWVQKVVNYMSTDISKSKMLIGVPTYGAEYQAMTNIDGSGFAYTKVSAFNPQYGITTASQNNITPSRNSAGELSFSYVPSTQTSMLPSNSYLSSLASNGTASAFLAAVGALNYSKQQNKQAPVEYLTWSDSVAIQAKATLAQQLGVAGIAIFKIDGGEDPNMWGALSSVTSPAPAEAVNRATIPLPTSTMTISSTGSAAATTTPDTGCTPGAAFSTTTGKACPVVVITGTTNAATSTTATSTTKPTTTSTTVAPFTKDLSYGASGADVTRLQKILIAKGYLKVAANGNFGPSTLAALKKWQKAVGLSASGMFGPQSRAKIVQK